jgi:MoaA/NifB/PqqE/SkfB family radical SAM enzyme
MEFTFSSIRNIELEISTYCNAACPQCPRNNYGGKTIENLPLINWKLEQLISVLDTDFVKQLELIYFCGTYGDPLMNPDLTKMCAWLMSVNPNLKIGIHTNGGVGSKKTYEELATLVDFVAFGIDGLEDTNHLYRRNTNWHTIIKNAKTYIDAGGKAVWDFIVFKHNQHQVDQAQQLSISLGFSDFNIKKTGRFFNKNHQLVDKIDVLDYNGNKEYELKPPDNKYLNTSYESIKKIDLLNYIKTTKIECYWMKNYKLYIGADGNVFPCGFLHDRLYGIEAENNSDHLKILNMMDSVDTNVFKKSLKDIVDGEWFARIKRSWENDRLERCAIFCGDNINLLKDQNKQIMYKEN